MTFNEWFFGKNSAINTGFDNPSVNMQWKLPHILVLLTCIATIITIACIFRKKSDRARKIVLWVLVGAILFFEVIRRVKNIISMVISNNLALDDWLYTLLPRPWCAISCWSLIIAATFNKKYLYNVASSTALLCAIIFFAYPSAGFNNTLMEFENIYSISTHSLLLVTSISMITLKFTDFRYKDFWKDMICLAVIMVYACIEIWILKISDNPLYFLPMEGNEVQEILGLGSTLYIIVYWAFLALFINLFYLINDRKNVFKKHKK